MMPRHVGGQGLIRMCGRTLVLAFLILGFAIPASAKVADEYEVKAAFLVRFAEYVEWPSDASQAPGQPLNVCVLGNDPFGRVLDAAIAELSRPDRPLQAHRVPNAARAAELCHLLFIDHYGAYAIRRDLALLRGAPVLTVGDAASFVQEGGVIAFRIEQDRVRLTVNLAAAQRAGLRISSRLLSIAHVIHAP
jgi:hypothetical protein